ncbi:MAG: glycosyltransferase [Dehalococcoidales bacterium]|nr:glycosyltransferase [Dehalococcoidales bacterium]
MKALFIHSARFVRTPDGNVFSNGQFPHQRWERYLKYFDALKVICRMSYRDEMPENWNLSSWPRVTFIDIPDDHGKLLMQLQKGPNRRIVYRQMNDCDAVIIDQSTLGWSAAQEAEKRRIPWAIEVVSDVWNAYWYYGTLLGKLYAPFAWRNSRYWIRRADFAIYVTHEYLQKKYPCRGLFCGVSDVQVNSVPISVLEGRIARWRIEQPTAPEALVVGMIGSLFNRYKGLHVALRALRRLRDQGILLQLHVLGNGRLDIWRQEARRLGIINLLYLDGSLPSGEPVMQWLDKLDIYVQPSFQEGLPRALIEAMSRGLPALGSICGGIPELLPVECLHCPGDDKILAKQLARMVQDSSWRISQAQRNFKEAKNYYSGHLDALRDAFWCQFAERVRKRRDFSL